MQSVCKVLITACIIYSVAAQTTGTSDDAQIDETMRNADMVHKQSIYYKLMKCALGEGPCDDSGMAFKYLLPKLVRGIFPYSGNDLARNSMKRIIERIQKDYPDQWQRILVKYHAIDI